MKHSFFKIAPEWRQLSESERWDAKAQFAGVLEEFSDRVAMSSYSLVGTQGDVDLMLWKVSPSLEAIDELMAQVNRTRMASYLSMPHSYVAMTRPHPTWWNTGTKGRRAGRPACASWAGNTSSSIRS